MTNEKIIPLTIDQALSDVDKLCRLVDAFLVLGDKIKSNEPQLQSVQAQMRQMELNNNFYTIAEVAEALSK